MTNNYFSPIELDNDSDDETPESNNIKKHFKEEHKEVQTTLKPKEEKKFKNEHKEVRTTLKPKEQKKPFQKFQNRCFY